MKEEVIDLTDDLPTTVPDMTEPNPHQQTSGKEGKEEDEEEEYSTSSGDEASREAERLHAAKQPGLQSSSSSSSNTSSSRPRQSLQISVDTNDTSREVTTPTGTYLGPNYVKLVDHRLVPIKNTARIANITTDKRPPPKSTKKPPQVVRRDQLIAQISTQELDPHTQTPRIRWTSHNRIKRVAHEDAMQAQAIFEPLVEAIRELILNPASRERYWRSDSPSMTPGFLWIAGEAPYIRPYKFGHIEVPHCHDLQEIVQTLLETANRTLTETRDDFCLTAASVVIYYANDIVTVNDEHKEAALGLHTDKCPITDTAHIYSYSWGDDMVLIQKTRNRTTRTLMKDGEVLKFNGFVRHCASFPTDSSQINKNGPLRINVTLRNTVATVEEQGDPPPPYTEFEKAIHTAAKEFPMLTGEYVTGVSKLYDWCKRTRHGFTCRCQHPCCPGRNKSITCKDQWLLTCGYSHLYLLHPKHRKKQYALVQATYRRLQEKQLAQLTSSNDGQPPNPEGGDDTEAEGGTDTDTEEDKDTTAKGKPNPPPSDGQPRPMTTAVIRTAQSNHSNPATGPTQTASVTGQSTQMILTAPKATENQKMSVWKIQNNRLHRKHWAIEGIHRNDVRSILGRNIPRYYLHILLAEGPIRVATHPVAICANLPDTRSEVGKPELHILAVSATVILAANTSVPDWSSLPESHSEYRLIFCDWRPVSTMNPVQVNFPDGWTREAPMPPQWHTLFARCKPTCLSVHDIQKRMSSVNQASLRSSKLLLIQTTMANHPVIEKFQCSLPVITGITIPAHILRPATEEVENLLQKTKWKEDGTLQRKETHRHCQPNCKTAHIWQHNDKGELETAKVRAAGKHITTLFAWLQNLLDWRKTVKEGTDEHLNYHVQRANLFKHVAIQAVSTKTAEAKGRAHRDQVNGQLQATLVLRGNAKVRFKTPLGPDEHEKFDTFTGMCYVTSTAEFEHDVVYEPATQEECHLRLQFRILLQKEKTKQIPTPTSLTVGNDTVTEKDLESLLQTYQTTGIPDQAAQINHALTFQKWSIETSQMYKSATMTESSEVANEEKVPLLQLTNSLPDPWDHITIKTELQPAVWEYVTEVIHYLFVADNEWSDAMRQQPSKVNFPQPMLQTCPVTRIQCVSLQDAMAWANASCPKMLCENMPYHPATNKVHTLPELMLWLLHHLLRDIRAKIVAAEGIWSPMQAKPIGNTYIWLPPTTTEGASFVRSGSMRLNPHSVMYFARIPGHSPGLQTTRQDRCHFMVNKQGTKGITWPKVMNNADHQQMDNICTGLLPQMGLLRKTKTIAVMRPQDETKHVVPTYTITNTLWPGGKALPWYANRNPEGVHLQTDKTGVYASACESDAFLMVYCTGKVNPDKSFSIQQCKLNPSRKLTVQDQQFT